MSTMTLDDLIRAVEELPESKMAPTYYVDADEDLHDYAANHSHAFCHEHAVIVAWWTALESGFETWICAAWTETDRVERCAFRSCDRPLRSGGLTSHGVDDALALTETNPFTSTVYPAELVLSADAMMPDDPRWKTWKRQARRVLRNTHRRTR